MGFDRSKFAGASIAAQKEVRGNEPKTKGGGKQNTYLTVEEGRNTFRIAPPHKPEHSSYEIMRSAMLEVNKPIWEDGEKTDRTERGKKKIFSAMVHSDALKHLGAYGDPVELYVKMVKDRAYSEFKDKTQRNKFLAPISGARVAGKWIWGIDPKTSYKTYAWDADGTLGELELYSTWIKEMDKITASMELDGEVLEIDPFSDIDSGYPLVIDKDKDEETKKWGYTVSAGQPSRAKKESWEDFFDRTAITDAQLEELSEKKSLNERYVNAYKMSDFDFAIDGLQIFDETHGFKVFENETFLDAIQKISDILTVEEEKEAAKPENAGDQFLKEDEKKEKVDPLDLEGGGEAYDANKVEKGKDAPPKRKASTRKVPTKAPKEAVVDDKSDARAAIAALRDRRGKK